MKRFMLATVVGLAIILATAPVIRGDEGGCSKCATIWYWYFFDPIWAGCCTNTSEPWTCAVLEHDGWSIGAKVKNCWVRTDPYTGNESCEGQYDVCPPDDDAPAPASLLISLDSQPPQMSDALHGVLFEMNTFGAVQRIGWPNGARTGWLVLDRNMNGVIDGVQELFGSATRLSSGRRAADGYAALAEIDDDGTGLIDAQDSMWPRLRVWMDRNHNGTTERGELQSLGAVGIKAVSTAAAVNGRYDAKGNRFVKRGRVELLSGRHVWSYSVSPAHSRLPGVGVGSYYACGGAAQ